MAVNTHQGRGDAVVSVRVPDELVAAIRQRAAETGLSISDVVRSAIAGQLDNDTGADGPCDDS